MVGLMASVEVMVSECSNSAERTDGTILKLRRQPLIKLVLALVLRKKSSRGATARQTIFEASL